MKCYITDRYCILWQIEWILAIINKYCLLRNTYCIHIYNYNVIEIHYMGNRAIYNHHLNESGHNLPMSLLQTEIHSDLALVLFAKSPNRYVHLIYKQIILYLVSDFILWPYYINFINWKKNHLTMLLILTNRLILAISLFYFESLIQHVMKRKQNKHVWNPGPGMGQAKNVESLNRF